MPPTSVLLNLLLRHSLTALGGALAAKGLIDEGSAAVISSEAFVGGLMVLGGVALSYFQKKVAAK